MRLCPSLTPIAAWTMPWDMAIDMMAACGPGEDAAVSVMYGRRVPTGVAKLIRMLKR